MLEYIKGVKCGLRMSLPHISYCYVKTPVGVVLALLPLYGIDKLIKLSPVVIPSSVVCMLALFLGLLLLERVLGTKRASTLVSWVDIPCGFALRWMGIFFTTSFTLLPLAAAVSVAEAFEIAGIFVFGYLVLIAAVVFVVQGLQKFTGTRRRPFSSTSDRDSPDGEIEMSSKPQQFDQSVGSGVARGSSPSKLEPILSTEEKDAMATPPPPPIASINRPHNPGVEVDRDENNRFCVTKRPEQTKEVLTDKSKQIGEFIVKWFDWFVYGGMFIAGIPIYFAVDYALPLHLGTIVLLYFAALKIPAQLKSILHPIIMSGSSAILVVYVFSLIHGEGLQTSLHWYKTGRNYLYLFDGKYQNVLPGAGDVLSTLLDVSIVALAMPMYNYRSDLKRHFVVLVIPCLLAAIACFFVYPPLAYACGVESSRALAFMARSVTLALALPIVQAIQGSTSMISVIAILSGIVGALFGSLILGKRGLRVRQDDYVTRGIALGISSSAVASASLLPVDPRAAALSSLSFFLYGIILVIMSAITPLANVVRSWVNLPPV